MYKRLVLRPFRSFPAPISKIRGNISRIGSLMRKFAPSADVHRRGQRNHQYREKNLQQKHPPSGRINLVEQISSCLNPVFIIEKSRHRFYNRAGIFKETIYLKLKVCFRIVVGNILDDTTNKVKVHWHFAVFHILSEQIAHDSSEIFVTWVRQETA